MRHWIAVLVVFCAIPATAAPQQRKPADEPLLDWSVWQKYRAGVSHPAATVKAADVQRAAENMKRYAWARQHRDGLERSVKPWLDRLTPDYLARMVPATTPGDTLFTPCPACRDLGKPVHPHGQWKWSAEDAERLTCAVCGTVFPNDKYPESIVLHAKCGGRQDFSYCQAEPFQIFSYVGRPSFSGAIRAHKVYHTAGICRRMAEAYALTGKPQYAEATRRVLLRFAEVYPRWLIHVGYGEYADLDPHLAALNINALPVDELCPPPAKPDRRLHTGYWSAGRARGVGMEAGFVRQMVESYEFTCTAQHDRRPVFSDAERLQIEKDLLLESTVLLVADKSVNNKSVGNATAAALVGMSVGHPGLVRFGRDVFLKTVDGWFLPDGGTSESWGYATMTLSGIESLGQGLSGYTDPPGFRDAEGQRIDKLDLYHQTAYARVWGAMFRGLQGDLTYPPLADGSRKGSLGARFVELMADNYPDHPEYLALLKELAGNDLSRGDREYALYYREPGLEQRPSPPLSLPDYAYPALQIGYLRSGPTGRASALVLSASDWGNHHHMDGLNLYYWQQGHELLSDLGYLWDHPRSLMTRRTFAHNTVMVDGKDQRTKGCGGKFTLFGTCGRVKVMEADSRAYAQAALYRRTVAQVEHAPGRVYVADVFRVQGGKTHDYIFHGPNREMAVDGPPLGPLTFAGPADVENVRGSDQAAPWKLTWTMPGGTRFAALWNNAQGETSLVADAWGQRDYRNTDIGATLPYVIRRCQAGPRPTVFVGVFEESAPQRAVAKGVRRLPVPEAEADHAVALAVETDQGVDYFVLCQEPRALTVKTPAGLLETNGRFAAVLTQRGQPLGGALFEGKVLRWNGKEVKLGSDMRRSAPRDQ